MAAMFKAQTANWEETQEKMTQLVSRLRGFLISCSIPMSHERNFLSCFSVPFLLALPLLNSAVRIYNNPRGAFRGGKPHTAHTTHQQPERTLPPNYVCYRCGQKGPPSFQLFFVAISLMMTVPRSLDTRLSDQQRP
jgi:protein MPE1